MRYILGIIIPQKYLLYSQGSGRPYAAYVTRGGIE